MLVAKIEPRCESNRFLLLLTSIHQHCLPVSPPYTSTLASGIVRRKSAWCDASYAPSAIESSMPILVATNSHHGLTDAADEYYLSLPKIVHNPSIFCRQRCRSKNNLHEHYHSRGTIYHPQAEHGLARWTRDMAGTSVSSDVEQQIKVEMSTGQAHARGI